MRLPRLATRVGSGKVQDPADDSCQEHSQGCPPVETRVCSAFTVESDSRAAALRPASVEHPGSRPPGVRFHR